MSRYRRQQARARRKFEQSERQAQEQGRQRRERAYGVGRQRLQAQQDREAAREASAARREQDRLENDRLVREREAMRQSYVSPAEQRARASARSSIKRTRAAARRELGKAPNLPFMPESKAHELAETADPGLVKEATVAAKTASAAQRKIDEKAQKERESREKAARKQEEADARKLEENLKKREQKQKEEEEEYFSSPYGKRLRERAENIFREEYGTARFDRPETYIPHSAMESRQAYRDFLTLTDEERIERFNEDMQKSIDKAKGIEPKGPALPISEEVKDSRRYAARQRVLDRERARRAAETAEETAAREQAKLMRDVRMLAAQQQDALPSPLRDNPEGARLAEETLSDDEWRRYLGWDTAKQAAYLNKLVESQYAEPASVPAPPIEGPSPVGIPDVQQAPMPAPAVPTPHMARDAAAGIPLVQGAQQAGLEAVGSAQEMTPLMEDQQAMLAAGVSSDPSRYLDPAASLGQGPAVPPPGYIEGASGHPLTELDPNDPYHRLLLQQRGAQYAR